MEILVDFERHKYFGIFWPVRKEIQEIVDNMEIEESGILIVFIEDMKFFN